MESSSFETIVLVELGFCGQFQMAQVASLCFSATGLLNPPKCERLRTAH